MTHIRTRAGLLALTAVASACLGQREITFGPDDDDLAQLGTILASTTTSGATPDPDGYTVRLDESRSEPIAINGLVTFSSVKVGTYNVTLADFASNCSVTGPNPVYLVLLVDSTLQANFDVVCD